MIISVVNHKGGTGKTTTVINLGKALAEKKYRVLLVDFDAQGSLSYSLGIDEAANTIASAFFGEADAASLLIEQEGMHVLPASATLADVELSLATEEDRFGHLRKLLHGLHGYDFILIDCPPSLSLLTLNALTASSHVIVPMQLDVLALRGLDSMLETIRKVNVFNPSLEVLGVLPLMVDPRKNIHQEVLGHIRSNYNVRLFRHAIRSSVKAAEAPSFGKSVLGYAPSSTTASDYRELAHEVAGLWRSIHKIKTPNQLK